MPYLSHTTWEELDNPVWVKEGEEEPWVAIEEFSAIYTEK